MNPNTVKYPMVDCRICGETTQATYTDEVKNEMVDQELCFTCLFWTKKVAEKNDPTHFVCNGDHYVIGPVVNYSLNCRGFGGRKFVIQFNDGRQVTTTNLWHQGKVPDRFISELPDTAIFI